MRILVSSIATLIAVRRAGLIAAVAGAAVFGLRAHSARAANGQWNGTTDSIWATATNWSATPVPGTGDTATFNNAANGRTTLSLGGGVTINTILFDTVGAAAFTIGSGAVGNQVLTLDNGGAVTMNAAVATNQLFNAAIVLGTNTTAASYTFTNNSTTNTLTLAGNISRNGATNTKTLNVAGAGNTVISGIIGGGAIALAKSGTGKLTLTNANTFTGAVAVTRGILSIQNGGTLGTTGGGVVVGDKPNQVGATLQLEGGVTVGNEPLTLIGGFASGATGALQSVSGTNNYGGLITLDVPMVGQSYFITISSDAGSTLNLTNTGTISGNSTLNLAGGGEGSVASIIGATVGALSKEGTGTWTLTGANTFAGPIYMDEGKLKLAGAGQLGTSAVRLGMNGGTLDLGGRSQTVSGLSGTGGGNGGGTILNNGGGTSTLTVNADASINAFYGILADNDNATAGTLALTKTGTGTLFIGGANTYSGATLINNGVLSLDLGGTLGNTTGSTTVSSGATLQVFENLPAEAITISGAGETGSGGALVIDGACVYPGLFKLGTSATILANFDLALTNLNPITGAAATLTFSGPGNGSIAAAITTTTGGLIKNGAGKLTLTGLNTFTGAVTINGGTLNIQTSTGLGTAAGGVTNNGILQLEGGITVGAEALTLGVFAILQSISGANAYGGTIALSDVAAQITANAGASLNLTGTGAISGSGTLDFNVGGPISVAGILGANVTPSKTGAATLTLSGANNNTVAVFYAGGLKLSGSGRLGSTSVHLVYYGGTIDLNGTSQAIGELERGGDANSRILNNGSGTSTFTVGNGNAFGSFAGAIIDHDNAGTGLVALTKNGTGIFTLSGANTYSGATLVSGGTLSVSHNTGLGSTASGTSVSSAGAGATLALSAVTIGNEALTLGGDGAAGTTGALVSTGATTYGGLLTLTAATTISVESGALSLSNTGTITGPSFGLTLTGAGDGVLAGKLGTTSGALIKNGMGKWTLTGANTYTGATTINTGTLNIQNDSATGTTAGGVVVANAATLQLEGGITVGAETLSVRGTGAAGATGALQNVGGTNNYGGAVSLAADTTISSDAGELNLTNVNNLAGATFDLLLAGAGNGSIASVIAVTTGTVTKNGAGTWKFTGANTFTGVLTVTSGTLSVPTVNDSNVAGPLGKSTAAAILGSSGGTATLQYTGGTASSTKPFTLATGGTGIFQIDSAAANLTLGAAVGGSGALRKTGAGALTLGVANSYAGGTTLSEGTLFLGTTNSLGTGTFTMNGGTISVSGSVVQPTIPIVINPVPGNVIDVPAGASLGFTGMMTGSGTVTKTGEGTYMVIGHSAFFTGKVVVSQGVAGIHSSLATGPSTDWQVDAGASLYAHAQGGPTTAFLGSLSGGGTVYTLSGGATLAIGGKNSDTTFSGVIRDGSFSLTNFPTALSKVGTGTLSLTGANSYTDATTISAGTLSVAGTGVITGSSNITVNAGGRLLLEGTGDRIGNAIPVTLNGGTFSTEGLSNQSESLGPLALSANSTINFGTGLGDSLTFDGVGPHLAGTKLSILNWTGIPLVAGGVASDRLVFTGLNASAFTGVFNQADVSFNGITGYTTFQIDSGHYEVVAVVPEPSTAGLLVSAALLGMAGARRSRRQAKGR